MPAPSRSYLPDSPRGSWGSALPWKCFQFNPLPRPGLANYCARPGSNRCRRRGHFARTTYVYLDLVASQGRMNVVMQAPEPWLTRPG
jgi:hypothetical protein